jgi:hypothetical protein
VARLTLAWMMVLIHHHGGDVSSSGDGAWRKLEFQSSPLTPCFGFLRLKLRWLRSKVVTL